MIPNTLDCFEATGMDERMPEGYEKLLAILDDAVKQLRESTQQAILLWNNIAGSLLSEGNG